MKLIIGADIVPTTSNLKCFEEGKVNRLSDDQLRNLLSLSSYNIFNLETPLCDTHTPIDKCGPCLCASSKSVNGYKALNIDLLTLANNHILDQGMQGLKSTMDLLNTNSIDYVGVGNDLQNAAIPKIVDVEGKRIGIYACSEHEFSVAGKNRMGANVFDPLVSFDHVNSLKDKCDYVIVLFHGGKEHFRYPSPNLQRICHKFVENGASIVVCQHSHCIGCMEEFLGKTIVYGQGNFLFDGSDSEFWKTGLLICIEDGFQIKYVPIVKNNQSVRVADEVEARAILDDFYKRSNEITSDEFVERNYAEFASRNYYECLLRISSLKYSFAMKVLNKLTKGKFIRFLIDNKYNRKKLLVLKNTIECEAWVELLMQGLNGRLNND